MIRILEKQYDITPIQGEPRTFDIQVRQATLILTLYPPCYTCNGKGMYYDGQFEAYDICHRCNSTGVLPLSHPIRFVQFLLRLSQLRIEIRIRSKFWLRILKVN